MPKKIKLPSSRRQRRWRTIGRYATTVIVLACVLPVALTMMVNRTPEVVKEENNIVQRQPLQSNQQIAVLNADTQQVMALDFEEYITGVVAAEMPASFELEALKAQAVAARTFAYGRMLQGQRADNPSPGSPVITTDPATCQAWINPEEQMNRWGNNYPAYSAKIAQAVTETSGRLVTYQGKPIEPLYHASCGGGRTEAAKDVWGGERPYLISVACNHPADKHAQQQTTLSLAQLDQLLGTEVEALPASGGNRQKIMTVIATTASDRVQEMLIGGESFTGSRIRSLLGLKSTLFTCKLDQDQVIFTTNGYGHGVGMCQYGANYYAQQGYDYQQILAHYYIGTAVD